MPLSSKIIRGFEKNTSCKVLELRHQFLSMQDEDFDVPDQDEPDVDPLLEASRIIAEAEEKAQKIVAEAQDEVQLLREQVLQEARVEADKVKDEVREAAFEQGKKEAMSKAASEATALREQARSVLRQAEEIRRQTLESVEAEIVRLSIEIAEKILSVKLNLHPHVVVEIAKEAIDMLHERDQVVLFVNPAEVPLFEDNKERLLKHLSPKGELHIIGDHDISPGGCIAETEHGRVDATMETRFENLWKSLEDIRQ